MLSHITYIVHCSDDISVIGNLNSFFTQTGN